VQDTMSAAGPPQGANCAPSGGSAAAALATPAASVGYIIAPRKLAMGNGIDSHCHVFDTARFPYSPDAAYQPPPHEAGTASELAAVLDAHDLSHALLVNPTSGYRYDNRCMIAAIRGSGGRFKGIARVPPD